jgi:hypothetical protein
MKTVVTAILILFVICTAPPVSIQEAHAKTQATKVCVHQSTGAPSGCSYQAVPTQGRINYALSDIGILKNFVTEN